VVGNQIGSLTIVLSFGHNLCFKYPNGSCEPILNNFVSRDFQCYKELFNSMNFDPCNHLLKIRESIGTQFPKWEPTWECVTSFSHTLYIPRSMKCDSWVLILGSHLCKPLLWSWAQSYSCDIFWRHKEIINVEKSLFICLRCPPNTLGTISECFMLHNGSSANVCSSLIILSAPLSHNHLEGWK